MFDLFLIVNLEHIWCVFASLCVCVCWERQIHTCFSERNHLLIFWSFNTPCCGESVLWVGQQLMKRFKECRGTFMTRVPTQPDREARPIRKFKTSSGWSQAKSFVLFVCGKTGGGFYCEAVTRNQMYLLVRHRQRSFIRGSVLNLTRTVCSFRSRWHLLLLTDFFIKTTLVCLAAL